MEWQVDLRNRSVIRFFGIVTATILGAVLALNAMGALGVLAVAGFIALAVHAPVTVLASYMPRRSRYPATLLVFLAIAGVMALIINLIIPLIITQGQELLDMLPGLFNTLTDPNTLIGSRMQQWHVIDTLESGIAASIEGITRSAELTTSLLGAVIRNVINFLFTVAVAFLIAVDGPRVARTLRSLLPDHWQPHARALSYRVYRAVSGFVYGQLAITTIAAMATFILLSIFNIPAPLSLAAFIWLTGLIPMVGNTLGAVMVIAVALTQSVPVAVFLIAYYVVYQQIENNVFEPMIQSRTAHLTPLIVLVSMLIGVHVAGFAGALLAIPAGASLRAIAVYALQQWTAEPEEVSGTAPSKAREAI